MVNVMAPTVEESLEGHARLRSAWSDGTHSRRDLERAHACLESIRRDSTHSRKDLRRASCLVNVY